MSVFVVVPQLVPIIKELDKRVAKKYKDPKVQIIDEDDRVHMAHIDIHYGFSVNGVAAIHKFICCLLYSCRRLL